ncbi:helix-turn-helix domain-containing protein [Mycobacteroides chelonae]|uniref:helix-turn-helix domain-containing protein n=1 Tax=Mycobacteroides chelonae TaxID=1774 RepID=UPI0035675EF4
MAIPDRAEAEERQRAARALDLRTSGMTYAAVAAELGYSDESGPRKAVDRLLSRIEHEGVSELRQLEGQRLDAMQRAIWTQACGGDIDAIKATLNVMARRAKLYGLDAPQRVQVGSELSEREFAERAAELIGEVSPQTLRGMFEKMPSGAAVLASERQKSPPVDDYPPRSASALSGQHRPESGTLADDSDDGWSNIGDAPEPPEPEDDLSALGDVPLEVVQGAKAAALQVLRDWKAAQR